MLYDAKQATGTITLGTFGMIFQAGKNALKGFSHFWKYMSNVCGNSYWNGS